MIRILKTILGLCFFPLLTIGLAQGIQEAVKVQTAVPVIVVEGSPYEFGQVSQGETVTHDFRVLNQGAAPLEIKEVKPG